MHISINRTQRIVICSERPNSKRAIIKALEEYWKDYEPDFSMTEVAGDGKVFFNVTWIEDRAELMA